MQRWSDVVWTKVKVLHRALYQKMKWTYIAPVEKQKKKQGINRLRLRKEGWARQSHLLWCMHLTKKQMQQRAMQARNLKTRMEVFPSFHSASSNSWDLASSKSIWLPNVHSANRVNSQKACQHIAIQWAMLNLLHIKTRDCLWSHQGCTRVRIFRHMYYQLHSNNIYQICKALIKSYKANYLI